MHKASQQAKQLSELGFWASEYVNQGRIASRFDDPTGRYLDTLKINQDAFRDKTVVDIGCGPVGALRGFEAKLKFGVDVLVRSYQPFGIADHDIIYLAAPAEDLPFLENFADAVVSLNALDHVDDFELAIKEIHRVLKPGGQAYLGLNLDHNPTLQEPQLLTQPRVIAALDGLFSIEHSEVVEFESLYRDQAPGGQLVIHGAKLIGEVSDFQQKTLDVVSQIRSYQSSTEERDLAYVLQYGAPAAIVAERAAANAFVEYRLQRPQWQRRLLRSVAIAITRQPSKALDRGLWSISVRAVRSMLW